MQLSKGRLFFPQVPPKVENQETRFFPRLKGRSYLRLPVEALAPLLPLCFTCLIQMCFRESPSRLVTLSFCTGGSGACGLNTCREQPQASKVRIWLVATSPKQQQQCGYWKPGNAAQTWKGRQQPATHKWPFPRRFQDSYHGPLPSKLWLLTKAAPSLSFHKLISTVTVRRL